MAGHSKWANIKRTKEVQDAKRSAAFTKIAKDIANAAKLGESGDLEQNPMLRVPLEKAKAANMPKDKIEKAINRGLGIKDSDDVTYENSYEFYGPNGSTFIVDTETDNPNRTITYLKNLANKNSLKMANAGSISYLYKEIGRIKVKSQKNIDETILGLMEIEGVLDVYKSDNLITIETRREGLANIVKIIKKDEALEISQADLIKVPDTFLDLSKISEQLRKIEDAIWEVDSVNNIWNNYNEPE